MHMTDDKPDVRALVANDRFPRSAGYDPQWVLDNQMGPNALWLTEWLSEAMQLRAGMRVLDMGCGKGLSSVFLAREFDVRVWATDLWIEATDNWQRIRQAGVADRVFPIHAEAHALPFAHEFFDAICCVDSYIYYGTDDLYLNGFVQLVPPGGQIGIVVPGLMQEFAGPVPEHLSRKQASGGTFWGTDCWSWHTADWWRRLWERTGLVTVELADTLPDGWRHWLQWDRAVQAVGASPFPSDAEALEADAGRYIGLIRMVGRRKATAGGGGPGGHG
jgi:SAM-dependent methyltransferase